MKNITMCLRVKWGFKLAVKVLPFNFVILRSLHLNYQNPNSKQIFLMYSIVSEVVDQLFVFLELAFIWRLYFLVGWELKLSIMAYWSRWEPPSVQANLLYDFITSSITKPCNIHVLIFVYCSKKTHFQFRLLRAAFLFVAGLSHHKQQFNHQAIVWDCTIIYLNIHSCNWAEMYDLVPISIFLSFG